MAGWANMTMDKDSDGKVEKVYKDGARTVHEEYRKDGSQGEMTVILANGVIVSAEGNGVDMATLKGMVAGVDLAKIEATKRAAKPRPFRPYVRRGAVARHAFQTHTDEVARCPTPLFARSA